MKIITVGKNEMDRVKSLMLCTLTLIILSLMTACGGISPDRSDMQLESVARTHGEKEDIISAYELHKILTDHFGFVGIKLTDANYTLPDNERLAQLKTSDYSQKANGAKRNDWGSDDYAIAAMVPMRNYAFGTMYTASAAGSNKLVVNVLVNNRREVVYWDAQAGEYYQGEFGSPEFILF